MFGSLPPKMLLMRIHSAFGVGTRSRSLDYCNSQLVPLASRSTVLRICKEVMGPEDLPLRNPVLTRPCLNPTLGEDDEHICRICLSGVY